MLNLTLYKPGRNSDNIQAVELSEGVFNSQFFTLPSSFVYAEAIGLSVVLVVESDAERYESSQRTFAAGRPTVVSKMWHVIGETDMVMFYEG